MLVIITSLEHGKNIEDIALQTFSFAIYSD